MRAVGFRFLAAAALLSAIAIPLDAQAPPIRGEGGVTEFFQGRAVRTFAHFFVVDRVLEEGEERPNPERMRVWVYAQPLAFNLAPAADLNLTFIAPVVVKRLDNVVASGRRTVAGFGDVTVQGKYRLWKRLARESRSDAAFLAGLKLPTGATGARDADGNRLPIPAQAGSGSTDVFFQGSISHADSARGFGWFADLRYTAKTEGRGYEFGDSVDLDGGASKRLYPWQSESKPVELYAEMALLFTHAARDRQGGLQLASSGGDALFWAPGVAAIVGRRWLLETSFQFPITQQFNGTQLGQGWNVLLGLRVIY